MVAKRCLYALDMGKAIERVCDGCHCCASLHQTPSAHIEQSTASPPDSVGQSFAAELIKLSRQLILVLQDCNVLHFLSTSGIEDERHQTLQDDLIQLWIQMRPMDGPPAVICTDPTPGFKALIYDNPLHHHLRQDPQQEFRSGKFSTRT